jgi:hypothetical protein
MIQGQLHVFCDKCGAEGPYIVGPKRPELLKEIQRVGWKLVGPQHVCEPCANPNSQKIVGIVIEPNDRSVHWTAARQKSE